MSEALLALKDATYLGSVAECELVLGGHPLPIDEIKILRLWVGDYSSAVTKTDGSVHKLYQKRRLRRPRLMLKGRVALRMSATYDRHAFDVSEVFYMTLSSDNYSADAT
jgi:hypothetical protein